jgi:hypothetical protein
MRKKISNVAAIDNSNPRRVLVNISVPVKNSAAKTSKKKKAVVLRGNCGIAACGGEL